MAKSNPYEVQLVGELVDGRYRIERLLGHGGMGTVWLAIDERVDGRRVVVKVPRASFLEQEGFLDRFEREIQSLTRLDHPRIVKVLDVAHLKDVPVVVLQYLAGGSLAERTEKPMTPEDVVAWIAPVAEGLDFIHSQGVIHRDVKPGNILFDGYGNAFLADFGIAKALGGEETGLTSTGASPGSPSYMAPEAGTPDALGPNYDQYSLACVVYKALSGRLPHEGRTALEVILKRTVDPPVPLRQAAPQVDAAVEAVVMRALARRPADRFGSCRAFAAALVGAVTGVAPANPPTDFTTAETRVLSKTKGEPAPAGSVATPTPTSAVEPVAAATGAARRSSAKGALVAALAALVVLAGYLAWSHFHAAASAGPSGPADPVADADQSFTFAADMPRPGDAVDRNELVVHGTVSPASTREVDVGFQGDLRNPVPVGANGAVEARLKLPKEDGHVVVVVWTARRYELARLDLEIDRTPPRVAAQPKEPRVRAADEKTFVAAVDASEPVKLFDESGRRELAAAPAGASEVALELPAGATADRTTRTLRLVARDRCAHETKFEVAVDVVDVGARLKRYSERRPAAGAELATLRGGELASACDRFEGAAQAWERDVAADELLGARRDELLQSADWKALREDVRAKKSRASLVTVTIAAPADGALVNALEIDLHATVDPPGATVRVAVGAAPPRELAAGKDGVLDARLALPERDGPCPIDVTQPNGTKLAHVSVVVDRSVLARTDPVFTPAGDEPIDRSLRDRARVRFEFAEAVRVVALDAAGAPLAGAAAQEFADGRGELDLPFPPTTSTEAVAFKVVLRVEDRLGNRREFPHEFRLFDDGGRRQKAYDEGVKRIADWADPVRRAPSETEVADAEVRDAIEGLALPWLVRDRQSGIELVLVPPGSFEMGSKEKKLPDEAPPHAVQIASAFYVGRFEVTQEQWQRVTGANPSLLQDDAQLPVENVSFDDVRSDFLAKTVLRLPTEAEWEYVARGARKTSYPWGDAISAECANCRARDASAEGGRTRKVGSFPKGATWCGALDVSGNVWEWCADWYDADTYARAKKNEVDPAGPAVMPKSKQRVARGGSWYYFDDDARCARRMHFEPRYRSGDLGFRVAKSL